MSNISHFSIDYLAYLVDNLIKVRSYTVESETFDLSDKTGWIFGIIIHYRVNFGHSETSIIVQNEENYIASLNATAFNGAVSSYGFNTRTNQIKILRSSENPIIRRIKKVILFYI